MITKDKINEIGKDDYLLLSEIKPSRSHFSLLLFLLSFSLSLSLTLRFLEAGNGEMRPKDQRVILFTNGG
jgi:hypothetical protein